MATAASRVGRPERQNRLIFIGAVALAILAAVLVFLAASGLVDSNNGGGGGAAFAGSVDVVVAAEEVPAGTRITSGMLTMATLPQNGIAEGALQTKDGLEGLVVRQSMARGDQFTAAKVGLALDKADETLSAVVPQGMRGVGVEVDEKTTVGGLIVAGDHVDVLLVRDDGDVPTAQILLQDVQVLAVAQESLRPVTRLDKDGNIISTNNASDLSTEPEDTSAQEKAKTVTLAVPPQDAALLALAQQTGTVWLSLRGQGDREVLPNRAMELP